jgi:hypothetical protein
LWIAALVIVAVIGAVVGFLAADSEDRADLLGNGRIPVVGTSGGRECGQSEWQQLPADIPGTKTYLGTLVCPASGMSDPRVAGVEEWKLTKPYVEYTSAPPTGRFEASVVLTTEDGVWRGEGFGMDLWDEQWALHTTFYAEYVGEGPYEGLVYREWGAQYPGSNGYLISGYIEPAD